MSNQSISQQSSIVETLPTEHTAEKEEERITIIDKDDEQQRKKSIYSAFNLYRTKQRRNIMPVQTDVKEMT